MYKLNSKRLDPLNHKEYSQFALPVVKSSLANSVFDVTLLGFIKETMLKGLSVPPAPVPKLRSSASAKSKYAELLKLRFLHVSVTAGLRVEALTERVTFPLLIDLSLRVVVAPVYRI